MKEKTLEIYTDCACTTKAYGIGVLMIDEDGCETKYQYRTTNKLINIEFEEETSRTTTSVGEAYAILKSIENISNKYNKIILYTDNNHVFLTLNKMCRKKTKHKIFNKIILKCRELIKNKNIEFRHIKGHCGVYGNEMVDKLAKKALKDTTIPCCNNFTDKNLSMNIFEFNFFNSYVLDKIY